MRNICLVVVLAACVCSVHASSPAVSIHLANGSDRLLSIWINGDAYDLAPDSGIVFPCIENESHTVQTESEVLQVSCGESVELSR